MNQFRDESIQTKSSSNRRFIITGTPSSGKTTLITSLSRYFNTVNEPAREIIAEQRAINGSGIWDRDTSLFVNLLLSRHIKDHSLTSEDHITLFDRGIPDCIAYAQMANLSLSHYREAADHFRYNPRVLFLPAWRDIHKQDEERKMTFEQAKIMDDLLRKAYQDHGYSITEAPSADIDSRVAFVLRFLENEA